METRRRKNLRLPHFEYSSSGVYFVTVCTADRICNLGDVLDGQVRLSARGEMVRNVLTEFNEKNPAVQIDDWVVMPNHWHAVIRIQEPTKTTAGAINCAPTISKTVRGIKASICVTIRKGVDSSFAWQKNYYEHIVRNEDDYLKIREYVLDNPRRWEEDDNHPLIKGRRE